MLNCEYTHEPMYIEDRAKKYIVKAEHDHAIICSIPKNQKGIDSERIRSWVNLIAWASETHNQNVKLLTLLASIFKEFQGFLDENAIEKPEFYTFEIVKNLLKNKRFLKKECSACRGEMDEFRESSFQKCEWCDDCEACYGGGICNSSC